MPTETREESNFTTWARDELKRAGLFDQDSDYEGMMGDAVMELVYSFSAAGHSGFSASMAASIFGRLSEWKPLTPLTSAPGEWMDVTDGTWQSRRAPGCFSLDGGRTYYDIDEPLARWRRLAWRVTRRLGMDRRWEPTYRTDSP